MSNATPIVIAVLVAELVPAAAFGFAHERIAKAAARWPVVLRVGLPALLVLPYIVIATANHMVRWPWLVLYAALPVVIAWLLARASVADPEQRGNWRDAVILLALGLAVDLRWFDAAWPAGLRGLNNLLLVDAGLYGFLGVRNCVAPGLISTCSGAIGRRASVNSHSSLPPYSCSDLRSDSFIPMPTSPAWARPL